MILGGFWKANYRLDKMTPGELWVAYFQFPAIQVYLALAAVCLYLAWRWFESLPPLMLAAAVVVGVYPFVWYLLHRFVLHGAYLYRSPLTAGVWKRIHFDHHRDPNDLSVLFGALYTTLPTVALVVVPIGWAIGGAAAAALALSIGLLVTCFYEYCHCIQHLRYAPKWRFLRRMKRLHLAHHFHNETGNFGITSFLPDKVFATYYEGPKALPSSATVFNLGYTGEEVRRFPWVARLTPDLDERCGAVDGVGRRQAGNSGRRA